MKIELVSHTRRPLIGVAAQREESRGHGLEVEDAVACCAKGLRPLARQRFWHARVARQTKAHQVPLVGLVIHEAVAAVQDGRVVDEVEVARLRRKLKLKRTRDGLDGLESLDLLAVESREVSLAGMSGRAHQRRASKVDGQPAVLVEQD